MHIEREFLYSLFPQTILRKANEKLYTIIILSTCFMFINSLYSFSSPFNSHLVYSFILTKYIIREHIINPPKGFHIYSTSTKLMNLRYCNFPRQLLFTVQSNVHRIEIFQIMTYNFCLIETFVVGI